MCDTSSDNDSIIDDTRGAMGNVVVPEKSKDKYNKAYTKFMEWKVSKNNQSFNEDVLLAYFMELSDTFKPSSLWTLYSMLKSTLILNNEVDISKYSSLIAFLKRKTQTCPPVKKSKTFTPEEINRYLKEAHDNEHLLTKVVMIFGIVGGCRRYELYNLLFTDVEVYANKILVKIYNTIKPTYTKTYRLFTVTGSFFELCRKYIILRPLSCKTSTFFLQYKSGKCRDHPIGINLLGNLSKSIARFLELPDPDLYTGHCFRRTSTKLLLYPEGDQITMKKHSNGLRTTTLPEHGGNSSMESSHNNKTEVENRNVTSNTIPEGYSNNLLKESNVKVTNNIPNTFEDQEFECVNINIPSGTISDGYTSDSMDSKNHVWNDIQNTVINKNNVVHINTLPNVSKCNPIQDSVENNTNKVVNINIPGTSTNGSLQESVSALVCFNNCRIQNVNINYTK